MTTKNGNIDPLTNAVCAEVTHGALTHGSAGLDVLVLTGTPTLDAAAHVCDALSHASLIHLAGATFAGTGEVPTREQWLELAGTVFDNHIEKVRDQTARALAGRKQEEPPAQTGEGKVEGQAGL